MACPLPVRSALALLAAAPLALAAPGDVWTVGPAGADFTQIQPAVDAAADGDLILVKPGSYAKFSAQQRALTIVAELPGSVQVAGPVRVSGVPAERRVALIDLSVEGDGESALILSDNQGSVRVRGGTWSVVDHSVVWWESPRAAVRMVDCADVALRSATLRGHDGIGAIASPISGPGSGGAGLVGEDSSLALYHCTLSGGDGGSDFIEEGYNGGWGGSGLVLRGGFVHLVNCTLTGGDGGHGGEEDGIPPFYNRAGDGGHGGDGVNLVGGATWGVGPAHGQLLAVTASGGQGGAAGLGYWEEDGAPGEPGVPLELVGDATSSDLPGPVVRLIADGLWRPGTPETLSVYGKPGDAVWLVISPKPGFRPVAVKQGVLLLGGLPVLKQIGSIPAGGVLTVPAPAFGLPPGWDGRTVELQAWAWTPGVGTVLSGFSTTAIVDPAF